MTRTETRAAAVLARSANGVDGAGQVLRLVRDGLAGTTSELTAATGVSRSTVTHRLDALVEHGLVTRDQAVAGSRGRPAAVYRFNPAAGVVLAAQVGMTGSRFAATDLDGRVLAHRFVETRVQEGPELLAEQLAATFDELLTDVRHRGQPVLGLGIGLPSALELSSYTRSLGVLSPSTWDRGLVTEPLQRRFGVPVVVDLDVNLLALSERERSWPDTDVFVCLKLGTVINASIVVDGEPIHGSSGLAGEFGHMKLAGSQATCSCGATGCLDAVASGRALVADLRAAGHEVTHVAQVVQLAQQEVPEAVLAVRSAGRAIGEVLASVVNLLNPGAVCAWGYLADAGTTLFAGMREGLYQNALPDSSHTLQLGRAGGGDLSGPRGGARMVINQVLEPSAVDLMVSGDHDRTEALRPAR